MVLDATTGRLGIYVDARYCVDHDGERSTDIPFVRFACEVGTSFAGVAMIGRVRTGHAPERFALPPHADLIALPDYPSVGPMAIMRSGWATARAMWRALDDLDCVWIFGPHPFGALLAGLAIVRGRGVALGVRQDTRQYFSLRANGVMRAVLPAVAALDALFVALSRRLPTVVVGRDLAERYGSGKRPAIVTAFCQLRSSQIEARPEPPASSEACQLITVGRIEPEKNPMLLVEAMAELERLRPGQFRLQWVGSGKLTDDVRASATRHGLDDVIAFRGYVPFGNELVAAYRESFAFVHVSRTEGVPQVLFEAMGSGVPVVATAVGGVGDALNGGRFGLLVPPGDRDALVSAVLRLADDEALRARLTVDGAAHARRAALDVEGARIGAVLADAIGRPRRRPRDRVVHLADRLGASTLLRVVGRRDRITVLAYHRVIDGGPEFGFDEGLRSATPDDFARQMEWVASRFTVVSLDEFREIVSGMRRCPRNPLLITFDDGYADNVEHALPVLVRLGLPAVVFVATDAIDQRGIHWWDALSSFIHRAPPGEVEIPLLGVRSLATQRDRAGVIRDLRVAMKRVDGQRRHDAVRSLAAAVGLTKEGSYDVMMTWDQARKLVRAGVECQPHTAGHPLLPQLDAAQMEHEIAASMTRLRDELGTVSTAFAYPNGDYDERVVEVVRGLGLDVAFTMRPGPASLQRVRSRPLEIPRVAIECTDAMSGFRLKAAGALPFVELARSRPPAR